MALAQLDQDGQADLNGYFVTLTHRNGFSDDQRESIIIFHGTDYFKNVMLVQEDHESGERHYHAIAEVKCKQTAGVTRKYQRFYEANELEVTPNAIKVKRVSEKVGLFHYLTKDFEEGQKPLVLRGWRWTWIQEQVVSNLKKQPFKQLLKDCYFVNKKNGTDICLSYMKAHKIRVLGKEDYAELVCRMSEEKYRFVQSSHRYIYAEIMTSQKDRRAMRSMIANELFNMD